MSDKEYEYEIKYDSLNDVYTVKEKEVYHVDRSVSTDPTAREQIHDALLKTGRGGRIFFTLFFNWYGSLRRFSSNSAISFLFGLADIICGKIIAPILIICLGWSNTVYLLAPPLLFWIIDLISIFTKNEIIFLCDKKYLNYSDLKKRQK